MAIIIIIFVKKGKTLLHIYIIIIVLFFSSIDPIFETYKLLPNMSIPSDAAEHKYMFTTNQKILFEHHMYRLLER